MYSGPKMPWRISGDEVGSCNCAWGCPCQFNALPTLGSCEGLAGIQIREGYFGSTRLNGVCPNEMEPAFAPITLEADRERRDARLIIPGIVESEPEG